MGGNFTSCSLLPVCVCVWARRLSSGRHALLFANAGNRPTPNPTFFFGSNEKVMSRAGTGTSDFVAVSGALLAASTGLPPQQLVRARNLWTGTDGPSFKIGDGFLSGALQAAGVEMHVLTPEF